MNNNNNNNNLYINLPDYINNSLKDKNIIEQIKFEIDHNPDFKNDYEQMKFSLDLMSNTELDAPPDNYFNNLIPEINLRIEQSKKKHSFIWFSKIVPYWKYAVPVSLIVLFLLMYDIEFRDNKVNIAPITEISNTLQELNQDTKIDEDNSPDSLDAALTQIISDEEVTTIYTPPHTIYYSDEQNTIDANIDKEPEIKKGMEEDNPEIFDSNGEDDMLNSAGFDLLLDNELNKMTPEQQKKILTELKKSNF